MGAKCQIASALEQGQLALCRVGECPRSAVYSGWSRHLAEPAVSSNAAQSHARPKCVDHHPHIQRTILSSREQARQMIRPTEFARDGLIEVYSIKANSTRRDSRRFSQPFASRLTLIAPLPIGLNIVWYRSSVRDESSDSAAQHSS